MVENQEECVPGKTQQDNEENSSNEAPDCTDFEAQLEYLQNAMERAAAELEYKKQEQASSKADLDGFKKIKGEVGSIVSAYTNALESLKENKAKLKNYHCKKNEMVNAAIGDKKEEIIAAINKIECHITGLERIVCAKNQIKENQETGLETAKQTRDNKIVCFDRWKNKKNNTESFFAALKKFQDQIEQQESESKFAVMYYMLDKFKEKLDDFEAGNNECGITSDTNAQGFEDGLKKAWCEMYLANKRVQEQERNFKEAERELIKAQQNLQTAKDEKESNIIRELEKIDISCIAS